LDFYNIFFTKKGRRRIDTLKMLNNYHLDGLTGSRSWPAGIACWWLFWALGIDKKIKEKNARRISIVV
jgi:hypothetical protein